MIVLDSSFLVAYHNSRDVHHRAANKTMERLLKEEWGRILLPEYVFLEVTTVLARRRDLQTAAIVGETLLSAREIEFVPCSDVFLDAFEVFKTQSGTALTFADAAIVAIARRNAAKHIATFDSDFRRIEELTVVP